MLEFHGASVDKSEAAVKGVGAGTRALAQRARVVEHIEQSVAGFGIADVRIGLDVKQPAHLICDDHELVVGVHRADQLAGAGPEDRPGVVEL